MNRDLNRRNHGIDVGRLDFHDFWGKLQDRVKWKVGQKEIAVMAIDRIIDREGLNYEEIKNIRKKIKEESIIETKDHRRTKKLGFTREPFKPLERRPIFKN